MKLYLVTIACMAAVLAVSADVSHLFSGGGQSSGSAQSDGYHYDPPQQPQQEYLPPTPAPQYLAPQPPAPPPAQPQQDYLPPSNEYIPPSEPEPAHTLADDGYHYKNPNY